MSAPSSILLRVPVDAQGQIIFDDDVLNLAVRAMAAYRGMDYDRLQPLERNTLRGYCPILGCYKW